MKKNINPVLIWIFGFSLFSQLALTQVTFEEVIPPDGYFIVVSVGQDSDEVLIPLIDVDYNIMLSSYNGEEFTEVPNPNGYSLLGRVWGLEHLEGELHYLRYNDADSNEHLFSYDGASLTDIPSPNNFIFDRFGFKFQDQLYFDYDHLLMDEDKLFVLNGTELNEVNIPDSLTYGYALAASDDVMFLNLRDSLLEKKLFVLIIDFMVPDRCLLLSALSADIVSLHLNLKKKTAFAYHILMYNRNMSV